jgi:Alginate export
MRGKKIFEIGLVASLSTIISHQASAQFSLSGQFRLRSEFRDGYGSPLPEGTNPAFFISQRTRLNVGYEMYHLKFGLSIQDVRVWGQDVSTINRTTTQNNNGLMLYEAWAEILLTDTTLKNRSLSLKIGRQELIYDDQRLIGNSDWVLQGRRFDAGVLKFVSSSWSIHLVAAYNQNQENNSGTIYNPMPPGNYPASTNGGAMYKSLEFLHVNRRLQEGNFSFLFLTDQFSRYNIDTINNAPSKTYLSSTWSRATTGFYFKNKFQKMVVTASAYYQFGRSSSGQQLSTALFSGNVQYSFTTKFGAGGGVDYTSGGMHGATSNVFDPLYGTPHKFWGLMDIIMLEVLLVPEVWWTIM